MARTSRTFRVFISSTFNDLKIERNALQETVFPRLRALCHQHDARFQPIDLRWGVSEEASLDQQALNICLSEILRCQQTSPRPNFIILLGDRYGWCPPPPSMKANDFTRLLNNIHGEDEQALLREWYQLDENAVPPVHKLKPRTRGSKFEESAQWQPVETKLHTILAKASEKMGLSEPEQLPYIASATEQEIYQGALGVQNSSEHVFCFLRKIEELPRHFDGNSFKDLIYSRVNQDRLGDLSLNCREILAEIAGSASSNSAARVAERIREMMNSTSRATSEEGILNILQQALTDFTAKDYLNLYDADWSVDRELSDRQLSLKNRLNSFLKQNVYQYTANWKGSGITRNHIDKLCEDVFNSLSTVIMAEINHPHPIPDQGKQVFQIKPDKILDPEGLSHHLFAEDRLKFFVGRSTILASITNYLKDSQHKTLMIVGEGGTGKSALIAKAVQQAQAADSNKAIVFRFIGATPLSADGRSLLDSLCHEITRRYHGDAFSIPADYPELAAELRRRLQLARSQKPLVLFLDSLDQLASSEGARNISWLPDELPDHVSIIVSTRGGTTDTYRYLKEKSVIEIKLGGLSNEEGSDLLQKWMANAGRTLQPDQLQAVLRKFNQSGNNPLYLKLAFEEARLWASYDKPIKDLAEGVSAIIDKNMIGRLQNESNHGERLVLHTLGYLAASRYGLSEDEIVDLLSRDPQVYGWFFSKSFHLPSDLIHCATQYRRAHGIGPDKAGEGQANEEEQAAVAWLNEIRRKPEQVNGFLGEVLSRSDGPRMPIVLWSRLLFDLAPYLTERTVDGNPLLFFYHQELGEVTSSKFLTPEQAPIFHERMADYFLHKADPDGDHSWTGKSTRGLSEIPFHLSSAGKLDVVYRLLTDFKFLEHKASEVGVQERTIQNGESQKNFTGVFQLQEDYDRVINILKGNQILGSEISYPLNITAREFNGELTVYCPVCNRHLLITKDQLDKVIACPQEDCMASLKINPSVVRLG